MSTSTYKLNPIVMDDECTLASIPRKDSASPYSLSTSQTIFDARNDIPDANRISPVKDNAEIMDTSFAEKSVTENNEPMDISIPDNSVSVTTETMDTSIPEKAVIETISENIDTSISEKSNTENTETMKTSTLDESGSEEETADNNCYENQFEEISPVNANTLESSWDSCSDTYAIDRLSSQGSC